MFGEAHEEEKKSDSSIPIITKNPFKELKDTKQVKKKDSDSKLLIRRSSTLEAEKNSHWCYRCFR